MDFFTCNLTQTNLSDFAGLVTSGQYQILIKDLASGSDTVFAIGGYFFNVPAGFIICESDGNGFAEITWLYVLEKYRNKGLGTLLLNEAVVGLRQLKYRQVRLKFRKPPGIEKLPLESLLQKSGWSAPEKYNIIIHADNRVLSAKWLKSELPEQFEIFLWRDATEEELKQLEESAKSERWFPEYLSPFGSSYDPDTSTGLKHNGDIAGWMLTRRVSDALLAFDKVIVRNEFMKAAPGISLVAESIRLANNQNYKTGLFSFEPGNAAMQNFVNKRLCGYVTKRHEEHRSFFKL